VVYDVGGGPGAYALWLARRGYIVHLLDAVPLHVEQAQAAAAHQPGYPLADMLLGDARQLPWPDSSADVVLLMGPLYHLTERDDRVRALREARRVLRDGGLLVAVGIGRCVSALDGLFHNLLDDPVFVPIVERDLRDGQHRNPTNNPGYFTTAYLHRPDELRAEIADAGLHHDVTLPVEGPAWLLPDFDAWWDDPTRRELLLHLLRQLEREPSLLGVSAHLMAFAWA
jgi:SAM-dependent methyltransferase